MDEIREDSAEPFGDLPAVKDMAYEKESSRRGREARKQPSNNTRYLAEEIQHYRTRSPIRVPGDDSSVRSRSRSPAMAPAAKSFAQNKKEAQRLRAQNNQKSTTHKAKRTIESPEAQSQEISAVVSSSFCLKCFHVDGDPNGKGHPFVFCPRASDEVKQLAVVTEAQELNTPIYRESNGTHVVWGCTHSRHTCKEAVFKCPQSRLKKGLQDEDPHVSKTKAFGARALQFVCTPCRICQDPNHSALVCNKSTREVERWKRANEQVKEIYSRAHSSLLRSQKNYQTSSKAMPANSLKASMQQPYQPQAHAPVQQFRSQEDPMPQIHPSRLALQAPPEQSHSQKNGTPQIHPSRLALHEHDGDMPGSRGYWADAEDSEPDVSLESDALEQMLTMEMSARPNSWLEVALAIQGHLRHQLMVDITQGDPAEGTPYSIPLLEILDSRIKVLKRSEGAL